MYPGVLSLAMFCPTTWMAIWFAWRLLLAIWSEPISDTFG
jgi:hypothetical protein